MKTQHKEMIIEGEQGETRSEEVNSIDSSTQKREAYWSRIFTGDLRSVPQEVREKAGIPISLSSDDDSRLAGTVVRSWAADHLSYSKEQISSGWGHIRQGLAQKLGTGEDDHEIFIALSERNKIEKQDKEQLASVYTHSYSSFLQGKGNQDRDWRKTLPKRLHSLGVQMEERAAAEALDDRERLTPVLEKLEKGLGSFAELEAPRSPEKGSEVGEVIAKSYWNARTDLRMLASAPDIISAVSSMNDLDEIDRQKVYGMLIKKVQKTGGLGERVVRALNQGALDVVYNTTHFGMNAYAMGVRAIGNDVRRLSGVSDEWAQMHSQKVRNASHIFEEMKQYVRSRVVPLHDPQDGLAEQMLLDGLSSTAPAALAFTGPAGLGLLAASDVGRNMAEARSMNPDGDYDSQMGAAVLSGFANSALSLGMTKLGQNVVDSYLKTFRALKGAGGIESSVRSVGAGSAKIAGDVVAMSAENKAQELIQYGAQEAAAAVRGEESGVPWNEWVDRNSDPVMQAREAAGLFPFLLIASGKAGLRHFRNPESLLREGSPLSQFGVSEEAISRIESEADLDLKTSLIREAIRSQPVWGTLFLGKKAFEWAKILEDTDKPLFSSEREVREFLDMGPERIQKPWERSELFELASKRGVTPPDLEMNASIARERWFIRAEIPQSTLGEKGISRLQEWEAQERREERISLGGVRGRDAFIPEGIRETEVFSPMADETRRAFLSFRLEEIGKRAYKALLLRYRDSDYLPYGYDNWDSVTTENSNRMRKLIADKSVEIAQGKSWHQVRNEMSYEWWKSLIGNDQLINIRVFDWLKYAVESIPEEKRWAIPLSQELTKERKGGEVNFFSENLLKSLSEMECYAADSSDSFRGALPDGFRALCRLVWADQSDARTLACLIPQMHEFDVMSSRGFTPAQSFENVLRRHLGLVDRQSFPIIQKNDYKIRYRWMIDVMKRLEKVTPGLMTSSIGINGEKLWRVRYPNSDFSPWHAGKREAWNDMAAHLSIIYSPVGRSRRGMIKDWSSSKAEDTVFTRIREGMGGMTLVDDLSVRATADLVSQGYGRRSYRAPGDELVLHSGDSSILLEDIMGQAGIAGRKEIYEKYVGPATDVAAEASNIDVDNAKGMIINRLELYRKSSPLGMIEDRAEVVWDRMLRTGQLHPQTAWEILSALGRGNDKKSDDIYGDYVRLSEELSQLSKEWYLGNLDDSSVPDSVSMWARYSIARPLPTDSQISASKRHVSSMLNIPEGKRRRVDRRRLENWRDWSMTEEMKRLADSSHSLPDKISQLGNSDRFVSMLRDSTGMNRNVRVERFWSLFEHPDKNIFPVMERYVHSLSSGTLLDVLPSHMVKDLISLLSRGKKSGIFANREKQARHALHELSEALRLHPDIALWNPDFSNRGHYFVIREKRYPSFDVSEEKNLHLWDMKLDRAQVKSPSSVDNDWGVISKDSLPESWKNNSVFVRSIETLGLIRKDFSSRPVPSERGVYWRGEVIRHDSPFAPNGLPDSWIRDVPLGSGLEAIFRLDQLGETIKGAHYPLIHDWKEALNQYDNCVLYRDPSDHSHTVRLMPGMPEAALREARSPYVVHSWGGVFLNERSEVVQNYRDSYIPLERFHFHKKLPDISLEKRNEWKTIFKEKLLSEIANEELQKKFWWNERTGDGGFAESVIRLYEELGIRLDYEQGRVKISDPSFVETLRFVAHVVNSPKWLAGGFEYGTPAHKMILSEGQSWRRMFQKKKG